MRVADLRELELLLATVRVDNSLVGNRSSSRNIVLVQITQMVTQT